MNLFTPSRYDEAITHLALGVTLIDAVNLTRAPSGTTVLVEDHPTPLHTWRRWPDHLTLDDVLPAMRRHRSGRFSLLHDTATPAALDLRILDRSRRSVPRRLRVALPDLPDDAESPPGRRTLTVHLHPGAAYPYGAGTSVIRGRVVQPDPGGGPPIPVRWARVESTTRNAAAEVLGTAHGDDRGDFLLVVTAPSTAVSFLDDPIELNVEISIPTAAPTPDPADPLRERVDPLWDLPIEAIPLTSDLSDGRSFLPSHTTSSPFGIDIAVGTVTSHTFLIP